MAGDVNNYIAEAITEQWGERCLDFAEGCACCEAWAQYDRLTALEQENKRLREIVERAFRDGFHSGAYVVTTPDYAWEIAKVRADLAALTHEDKT